MTDWIKIQTDPTILSANVMDKRRSLTSFISSTLTKDKNRIIDNLTQRKKSDFSKLRGFTDHFSERLTVTGPSQQDEKEYKVPDNGTLTILLIDFPIGSHYNFKVDIFVDNAPIFEDLRGNASIKEFSPLTMPVKKQSVIKFRMTSDANVLTNAVLESYVDAVVEMDK